MFDNHRWKCFKKGKYVSTTSSSNTICDLDYIGAAHDLSTKPYIMLTDVIYHKNALTDAINYQTAKVASAQDCYTMCLTRNNGTCFSFR